jgi:putative zinc finger/helix-turn-helix YgiT family protein
MICFKCDNEEFDVLETSVPQEFRGEKLDVKAHVSACKKCGWQVFAPGQTDELRKRTADAYRKKHHLLTSSEIAALRNCRGMSQEAFAKFVDVGVASIKRWETSTVQEAVYDRAIRQKCGLPTFPMGLFAHVTGRLVHHWSCSISTVYFVEDKTVFWRQPIEISPKVSRITSSLTTDDELAERSRNWRKTHTIPDDEDLELCP